MMLKQTKKSDHSSLFRCQGSVGLWTVLVLTAIPILAVIGLLGVRAVQSDSAQSDGGSTDVGQWYEVTKRSFDLTVIASGELEAKQKVEVKSHVNGQQPIIEVVEEGTFVKEGDLLVKLDDDDIKDKIEQEQLNVEKARADKIAAEQNLVIEKNEADSAHKAAEVKLSLAQLDLEKWANGEVRQKRSELKLAREKATRRFERAKRDHELSKDLAAQKFISANELEDSYIEQIEAENGLATAELAIEVYEKYTFQREEKAKNSDREQAQGELERTLRKNQSKIARLEADLSSKTRTLAIREDRLAELNTQLENTTILAPQEGMVVYSTSVGRRRRDPIVAGRQIRFNETIILLPDTRQMVAALRVHESRLSQIKIDQNAIVTIDARPGKSIACKVIHIGVTAEDSGWWNPNLREYKVKVELPANIDDSLKPAMRCSGEIIVGQVVDTFSVPIQAVFAQGQEKFCYLRAGRNKVRRQPVTIGRASESFVEITDGLELGQSVLMRTPKPNEQID